MLSKINILIAGGGTGGHLFPAFAIGEQLEKEGANVFYVGSIYGMEQKYKKNLMDKLYLLDIKGIDRNLSIKSIINNMFFPIRFIKSYLHSLFLIKKINPSIIIGTGGYSSGLPLLAGITLKVTSVIHEQNSYPGVTTRFLCNKVNKIFIASNSIKPYIPSDNYLFTGNPIRNDLKKINREEACNKIGLDFTRKIIFIIGGSQGSQPLNQFFSKNYKELVDNNIQLIWQTGKSEFQRIKKLTNNPNIIVKSFIKDINIAYSCSDIVVSRAGALTIEELKLFGKTMILVPYPQAANNHQELNALDLVNKKAAYLVKQSNLENELINTINYLLKNSDKANTMARNAENLYHPNAIGLITNAIKEYLDV